MGSAGGAYGGTEGGLGGGVGGGPGVSGVVLGDGAGRVSVGVPSGGYTDRNFSFPPSSGYPDYECRAPALHKYSFSSKPDKKIGQQTCALILPIRLVAVLIFGTARVVFDSSKNNRGGFQWQFWLLEGSRSSHRSFPGTDGGNYEEEDIEDCNVFEGKWIWDNISLPLYTEHSCPHLVKQVSCQKNDRPDSLYQSWRWQPNECNLPRFSAVKLYEILRNKRLMFVGDSIQRTQFDSMVCLLQSSNPNGKKSLHKVPSKKIFYAQVSCQKNGRPDSLYQFWRWQPNECNLPRFNAAKLLEILRNKRLMFVGDSIQRTQFDSMVCLLQSSIPNGKKSLHKVPSKKIFYAQDYNASVEFYWAPFIVESNSDHSTNHSVVRRLVKLDSIANHGKNWEGIDILVFESYVWWMYKPLINATYGAPYNITEYNVTEAYRIALKTWANWLEFSINPQSQKVFFMSLSPTHLWSWEWNPGSDGNCFNESYPIQGPYRGAGTSMDVLKTVQETLQELRIDVTLLNITQLSDYRKDAHTSVYTERKGKLLTKEQRQDPKNYADCIHWCLPGVPDTWNQILYAHLLQDY
ncbi:hypothetical protein Nepgr_026771 [Nepenthes gracilis]|uniref:Trichome birefringence-like N-terminal domain-containing protein n=1 Tax=Nepenthes gracilis TaxID=150966 RepID=A0AAD3Y0V4_NEPGR|nr:hypothetical protein Nepgr_026771 [Nepenthes gracilis]